MAADRSFTNLGTATVGDLNQAWEDRLRDADALLAAERFPSAVAMAVYSLEIRLKVRICQRLDVLSLPKAFEMHDLAGLLILSGLSQRLSAAEADPIKRNWVKITQTANLVTDRRYQSNNALGRQDAELFFAQLRDPSSGVLPWISNQS